MGNYFINKFFTIFYIFMFVIFVSSVYCYYFKISFARVFVYVIMPVIQMIYYIFFIGVKLFYLPYHILKTLWDAFLKIMGMFSFVLSIFNSIMLFIMKITDVSYLMAV
jgi:hypothetical protein